MKYGLLCRGVKHSFSPLIHKALFGEEYGIFDIKPESLAGFLESRNFAAINVTVPYKTAVIEYLDSLSEEAEKIGAVNTIVNSNGRLIGYNTDCFGLERLLAVSGADIKGKTVLIAGSGGTSKTALYTVGRLGAEKIIVLSRSAGNGKMTYDEAYALYGDADVFINTTPCGMFPDTDSVPADISRFKHLSAVVDVIYTPLTTRLVYEARKNGVSVCVNGLYMLVAQAADAGKYMYGRSVGESAVMALYKDLSRRLSDIVLIGMPGCGKTSVGSEIAARLGRNFYDIDAIVEENEGMPVADIILRFGEAYFRNAESEAVMRLSGVNGSVIACGGGTPLREENMRILRSNGVSVYIDRPVNELPLGAERPLSSSREAVKKLFLRRAPIYEKNCDIHIMSAETVSETASRIISAFREQI